MALMAFPPIYNSECKNTYYSNTNDHENYISGEFVYEMFAARALCTVFVSMISDHWLKTHSNSVFFRTITADSILTAYYKLFAYTCTGLHNLT